MSVLQNSINANATTPLKTVEGGSGVSSPVAHGVLVAEGVSGFNPISLTNGQLLVGNTSNDPTAATITAGTGIAITNSAGSITVGQTNSYQLIATATASSSASISFTGLSSTYFAYEILIDNLTLSTTASLYGRFSVNNGSSYDSSALYSYQNLHGTSATLAASSAGSQAQLLLSGTTITSSGVTSGTIKIFNPSGSQTYKQVQSNLATLISGPLISLMGCNYNNATAVNAVEILASTGTLTTGTFKLYGITG